MQIGKMILYSGNGHPPNVPMGHGPDDSHVSYPPNVPTGHGPESKSVPNVEKILRICRAGKFTFHKSQNGLEELLSLVDCKGFLKYCLGSHSDHWWVETESVVIRRPIGTIGANGEDDFVL